MIAPLLVILRVANKSALASKTIASGQLSSFKAGTRGELTDGGTALLDEEPSSSADQSGVGSRRLGTEVETMADSYRDI